MHIYRRPHRIAQTRRLNPALFSAVITATAQGRASAYGASGSTVVRDGTGIGRATPYGTSFVGTAVELSIAPLTDPGVDTDHTLDVRARSSGTPANFTIQLKDGNTVIQEWNQAITGSFVTYNLDISAAASISSYADLRIRMWATTETLDPEVSWVRLCVPSAPAGAVVGTGQGHAVAYGTAQADVIVNATAQGRGVPSATTVADVIVNATAVGHGIPYGTAVGSTGATITATAIGRGIPYGTSTTSVIVIATGQGRGVPSSASVSDVLILATAQGHGIPQGQAVVIRVVPGTAIGYTTPYGQGVGLRVINAQGLGHAVPSSIAASSLIRVITARGRATPYSTSQSSVIVIGTGVGHSIPFASLTISDILLGTGRGYGIAWGRAREQTQIITGILNPPRTYEHEREMDSPDRTMVGVGRSYSGDRTYDDRNRDGP